MIAPRPLPRSLVDLVLPLDRGHSAAGTVRAPDRITQDVVGRAAEFAAGSATDIDAVPEA